MEDKSNDQPMVELKAGLKGSLSVKGPVKVIMPDGKEVIMESCAICRCGKSKNQPFCDGSHRLL